MPYTILTLMIAVLGNLPPTLLALIFMTIGHEPPQSFGDF